MAGDDQVSKLCILSWVYTTLWIMIDLTQSCPLKKRLLVLLLQGTQVLDFHPIRRMQPSDMGSLPSNNFKCNLQHATLTDLSPGRGHDLVDLYLRSCISLALAGASDSFPPSGL